MLPVMMLVTKLTKLSVPIVEISIVRPYSSALSNAFYNSEQKELQKTAKQLIEQHINPFVNEWENAKQFPASSILKKFGDAGLLGICKPAEYGGLGLSYKYHLAFIEALSHIRAGGVKMGTLV